MFLICSHDVLRSIHEPSILSCPQAPAGHGALQPAGAPSSFPELAVAIDSERRRGRGAQSNDSGRYEAEARVAFDDGWQSLEELPPFKTTVAVDTSRKVIARNNSPDIGFDRSINPYRGCEHGCVYCFARPTHAYLGLSPGLDFESKLLAKPDAPALLEKELAAPDYEPRMIAIGTNTDPYQPIERERKIMRGILEVLERAGHPVGIVTKVGAGDARHRYSGADGEAQSGQGRAVGDDARRQTGAHHGAARLDAAETAGGAAATVGGRHSGHRDGRARDPGAERFRDRAHSRCGSHAGAKEASYVLLRLPLEVRDLFREWLMANYPDRYRHVFTLIRDMRGGRDYNSQWGTRMKGTGPMAWMIGRRFEIACEKLGLNKRRSKLTTDHFAKPKRSGQQLSLF